VPEFDAVVLAGGRSKRMAGTDKPALLVGGIPMLVRVAQAVASTDAGPGGLIVVGPRRAGAVASGLAAAAAGLERGLITVSESPAGGGPVAGLRCGLAEVRAPWLLLLAADLPFLTGPWLTWLLHRARAAGRTGAVPADRDGRAQWLASCWQAGPLREAVAAYGGDRLSEVLRPLRPAMLAAGSVTGSAEDDAARQVPWLDCDTPAQLGAARALATDGNGE
jgi:molybdopterin-guanine dinucleotide biosynthesis protein A